MKKILCFSDLQGGSVWGLWHKELTDLGDKVVGLNSLQNYLYDCWVHFWQWAKEEGPLDAIVLGGDAYEGGQPKIGGKQLVTPDRAWQKKNVQMLLGPTLSLGGKRYLIQGSDYHESPDDVQELGEWWEAEVNPETKQNTFEYLFMDIEGKLINFLHEVSPTVGFYVTTALERENMWSRINAPKLVGRSVDLNVRFHIHQATGVSHSSTGTQVCPGWQGQTRYMRRRPRSMYRMIPEIGGLLLIINGEDSTEPIRIKKQVYDLPKFEVVSL